MHSDSAASDAALRLVAAALESLHGPDGLPDDDLLRLRKLLSPRATRAALQGFCDSRWAVAVGLAELALAEPERAAAFAEALGLTERQARDALRSQGGAAGREAALSVVALAEGVTTRTLRDRIAGYRWAARSAQRYAFKLERE
jgi:hypothetical protein